MKIVAMAAPSPKPKQYTLGALLGKYSIERISPSTRVAASTSRPGFSCCQPLGALRKYAVMQWRSRLSFQLEAWKKAVGSSPLGRKTRTMLPEVFMVVGI